MNIEYKTSNYSKNYGAVVYSVTVSCKDDGVHFPRFSYVGYMPLKSNDMDKTDDELYDMVIEDLKKNYKKFNRITFEEQLEDPEFEYINISVKKEIYYDRHIKITE